MRKMQDSFIRNVITQEALQIRPCDSSRIRIVFAGINVSSFGKQGSRIGLSKWIAVDLTWCL